MTAVRTRPYHHGDLPNVLVAAGVELLAEGGVDALSLREAARRAGVSHAAPYRHFADKQALLDAIAAQGFAQLTEEMAEALAPAGAELAPRLVAVAGVYVRFALGHPAQFQLMFAIPKAERDRSPQLRESADAAFGVLLEIISRAQAEDQVISGEPGQLAWIIWSAVHGAATLIVGGHLDSAVASVDDLVRACVETLCDGLRPRSQ